MYDVEKKVKQEHLKIEKITESAFLKEKKERIIFARNR